MGIFWDNHKTGLVLGGISMHFLKIKVQNWDNFGGC